MEIQKMQTKINNFQEFQRQNKMENRRAVDEIGPGPEYLFFSSDYGNPIINWTLPYDVVADHQTGR